MPLLVKQIGAGLGVFAVAVVIQSTLSVAFQRGFGWEKDSVPIGVMNVLLLVLVITAIVIVVRRLTHRHDRSVDVERKR